MTIFGAGGCVVVGACSTADGVGSGVRADGVGGGVDGGGVGGGGVDGGGVADRVTVVVGGGVAN